MASTSLLKKLQTLKTRWLYYYAKSNTFSTTHLVVGAILKTVVRNLRNTEAYVMEIQCYSNERKDETMFEPGRAQTCILSDMKLTP